MQVLATAISWGLCLCIIVVTAIAVIAIVLLGVIVALVLELVRSLLAALFAVSKDDSGIGAALAEWYDTIRVIVVDVVRLAVDLGRGVVKRLSRLED